MAMAVRTVRAQHAETQPHRFEGGKQGHAVAARQQSAQEILGKGHATQCECTVFA
jgi:hypothetical protein